MSNIKTTLRSYYFDTRKPAEAEAYKALHARLSARGPRCFETWGGGSHYDARFADGITVELETKHVFADQWNTAPIPGISEKGLRVFDWAQDATVGHMPKEVKRGHYLERVPAMDEVRISTLTCGYCGAHHPAASGAEFCDKCLDSAYLKEEDLHLLRLKPAGEFMPKRAKLTPEEAARLVPLYAAAQTHGLAVRTQEEAEKRRKRVAKEYAEHVAKAQQAIERAATERDGFNWLLDRGMNTENVIFYNHTGRFGFGWRSPITGAALAALLDALRTFPYPYDVQEKARY